jgi:two-component system chemotaxis sensor kinase CheA
MSAVPTALVNIFREEARERLAEITECLLAVEAGNPPADAVDLLFRQAHSLKGGASMVGFAKVSTIAHAIEDALEPARTQGALAPELVGALLSVTDELRRAVDGEPAGAPDQAIAPIRSNGPAAALPSGAEMSTLPGSRSGNSVRLATEKVDRLLDSVGEAVVQRRRVEHLIGAQAIDADELLKEEIDREEGLLSELQDAALEMRMLPFSSITGRFPRAVRDLALAEGKTIELRLSGVETQIDRVLLDGLVDPITHLLRNAIGHGIESPEIREHAGKPRRAQLILHAESRGDQVAIEVRDDGRGVSSELAEEAARRGSLTDVLAEAGFSTAGQVTELAGRGVGLDAVKRQIESLSGRLEIDSAPGQGMQATLLLPVTLARFNVLIVERGRQRFGIPVTSVAEVVAVDPASTLEEQPRIDVRGESVRLSDLARVLDAEPTELVQAPPALVMGDTRNRVAIACDRVFGEEEVVVKPLGATLVGAPRYLGAAILGDGGILLIVDPEYLVRTAIRSSAAVRQATDAPLPAPPAVPRVLVVDDQFVVRELERSILDAAGYRVLTACHGREALEAITGDGALDLVVTDLQMPELDGLGLLAAIRADPAHATLPVVIVTSRGSDENRRRAVDSGANAYILKEEFDQEVLLETIRRLIGR